MLLVKEKRKVIIFITTSWLFFWYLLGRFQDEFVESRRIALERCLQKIVSHPMLYGDPDLKVFLESESFNVEVNGSRLMMLCNRRDSNSFLKETTKTCRTRTTKNRFDAIIWRNDIQCGQQPILKICWSGWVVCIEKEPVGCTRGTAQGVAEKCRKCCKTKKRWGAL